MLDLTKPLQLKLNNKWVDCELGKRDKDHYGVYVKKERSVESGGDQYMHYWTYKEGLRNKPQKFTKTCWLLLFDDGSMSIKLEDPGINEHKYLQIRKIEVEWEF